MHASLRSLWMLLLALTLVPALGREAGAHEPVGVPIADLTRRIAIHPDSLPLYLLRGELRRIGGDFEGAETDYAQIERREPSHPELALCRAALALDTGEPAAARRLLDASLTSRPRDARALRMRSRALVALGARREAMADLGAAIAAIPRPHPDLISRAGPTSDSGGRSGRCAARAR